MKLLKLTTFMVLLLTTACQQPDELPLSSDNTMTGLQCIIRKDPGTGDGAELVKTEISLINSSNTAEVENGNIKYVMDLTNFTPEDYGRARFEATIPATARIVEKDALGNVISKSIGYHRDVYNKVFYFYVIAADGSEKKYTVRFTTN